MYVVIRRQQNVHGVASEHHLFEIICQIWWLPLQHRHSFYAPLELILLGNKFSPSLKLDVFVLKLWNCLTDDVVMTWWHVVSFCLLAEKAIILGPFPMGLHVLIIFGTLPVMTTVWSVYRLILRHVSKESELCLRPLSVTSFTQYNDLAGSLSEETGLVSSVIWLVDI